MQYRSSPCGRLAVLLLVPCVFAPSPGRCLACMTYSTAQHSTVKYNTVQYSSTSFAAGLAASRGVWVARMCIGYAVVEKPCSRAFFGDIGGRKLARGCRQLRRSANGILRAHLFSSRYCAVLAHRSRCQQCVCAAVAATFLSAVAATVVSAVADTQRPPPWLRSTC